MSEHEFTVELVATALVRGSIRVKADNEDEAKKKALASTGDVEWKYDGLDDDAKVVNCEDVP